MSAFTSKADTVGAFKPALIPTELIELIEYRTDLVSGHWATSFAKGKRKGAGGMEEFSWLTRGTAQGPGLIGLGENPGLLSRRNRLTT